MTTTMTMTMKANYWVDNNTLITTAVPVAADWKLIQNKQKILETNTQIHKCNTHIHKYNTQIMETNTEQTKKYWREKNKPNTKINTTWKQKFIRHEIIKIL